VQAGYDAHPAPSQWFLGAHSRQQSDQGIELTPYVSLLST
jgi:hypothetical protein